VAVHQPGLSWITGAGGFIGSNLASALVRSGERVVGFGRRTPPARAASLTAFVPGGLSRDSQEQAIARFGPPDRVFHFAGGATVGRSITDPLEDFESNVSSTARLLDVLRRGAPDASVVLASSAAVYGSGHADAIPIDAMPAPFSPYGHHKLMAELLGRAYAENYGMRVTALRLFSVYGAGIRKQLVHDVCCRLERGEDPVVLGGTGAERRDWCHVDDVVALCAMLEPAEPGRPALFNVGSGAAIDIATLARMLVAAWGNGRSIQFSGDNRRGDPFSLFAAPDSLPPGFAPVRDLKAGLEDYVAWFRARSA
jgi:UDP-glucose 4-epimerase